MHDYQKKLMISGLLFVSFFVVWFIFFGYFAFGGEDLIFEIGLWAVMVIQFGLLLRYLYYNLQLFKEQAKLRGLLFFLLALIFIVILVQEVRPFFLFN